MNFHRDQGRQRLQIGPGKENLVNLAKPGDPKGSDMLRPHVPLPSCTFHRSEILPAAIQRPQLSLDSCGLVMQV